jgi:general secretion pathway protein C
MSFVSQLLQSLTRHQRRLWIILCLVVISFFSAKAVNRWVSYRYFPLGIESLSNSGVRPSPPLRSAQVDVSRIIARNLFDSTANDRSPAAPTPQIDESEIRPSSISADLQATIVFENPRYSVALIRNRTGNTSDYYGINDTLLNTRIVRIERFRVILSNEGRLESLELQGAMANIQSQAVSAPSPAPTRRPAPSQNVSFEEIAPGRFLIPQNTVDGMLSDLPSILRDARAIPNVGSGNGIEGFRLVEIRPDSIYDRLGLQNGDVVMRVNNDELNSVEKGMSLFTALRNEKSISIDIVRNGSRLNYTYEIR